MNKDNQTKANSKHHIIADTHANFSNSNDGGKTHSDDNANYTQWHTGFVQAMRLYLKDYENDLEFTDEFQLTRKPLSIDLTVVKKLDDITIKIALAVFSGNITFWNTNRLRTNSILRHFIKCRHTPCCI